MSDLFREEVFIARASRLEGKVLLPPLLKVWVFVVFIFVTMIAGLIFISSFSYERKETAIGWIVPESGAVRATAMRGGVVSDIFAQPGDEVEAGTPLIRIRLSVDTLNGDVSDDLDISLLAQLKATSKNAGAQLEQLEFDNQRLLRLVQGRAKEQSTLQTQITAQKERLAKITEAAQWAQENFNEGLTTRLDNENWEEQRRSAEQDLLSLTRIMRANETETDNIRHQIQRLPSDRRAIITERDRTIAAINERLVRNEADAEYVLTAPISGRVEAIPTERGQMLGVGETGAVLTPKGDTLLAEIFVPSRAIGFIENGQVVHLKYDAFPFQTFGADRAIIDDISQTILAPDEVSMAGISLQEPVYKIKARLLQESIEAHGRNINLRSGLTLTADVIIDKRSLLEWLLDPLFANNAPH